MGYRSEVMALVYTYNEPQKYEALKMLMNTTFKEIFDEWGEDFEWVDGANVLRFEADDVKWYDSYSQVRKFYEFLEEVERLGYLTEFIRVGENTDDVEMRASRDSCGYLNVARQIVSDV
jgi:hypothetical protein